MQATNNKHITLDKFIDTALYNKDFGFYMKKNPIEKLLRDAISFLHSDGTNDVLSLKAATFMAQQRLEKTDKRYSKRVAEAAAGQ